MNLETFEEKIKEPEKHLLDDNADLVNIWNRYTEDDNKSICGAGTTDINEINRLNYALIKRSGYLCYAPIAGNVVEIGSGYNSLAGFLNENIKHYPCDIVKRVPMTIEINNGELPFKDKTVDFVVAINCFQHMTINHRLKYIKEAHRILQDVSYPSLFVTYNMDNDSYKYAITGDYLVPKVSKKEFDSWLEVGFIATSSTFNNYTGMVGTWFIKQGK